MTSPKAISRALSKAFARVERELFPGRCVLCDLPTGGDADLCPDCADALPQPGPACASCAEPLPTGAASRRCGRCQQRPVPWETLQARCRWHTPADALVTQLKFRGRTPCARVMADLMVELLPTAAKDDETASGPVLAPVPLHWWRRGRRGFDQSELLVRALAARTGLPWRALLRRRRATRAQSGLDARARRRNLRGAFVLRRGTPPPTWVILVDDVASTGATLTAAARALRAGGVTRVDARVFARAGRDP